MSLPPSQPSFLCRFDASRYKKSYLLGHVSEEHVQKDVHDALALLGIEAAVVDAGFSAIRGKIYHALIKFGLPSRVIASVMSSLSGISAAPPGWTDLCGCLPPNGTAFFLEIKAPEWLNIKTGGTLRPAGKPSPAQMDFMTRMHKRGAIVGVAWSIDDAFEILGLKKR